MTRRRSLYAVLAASAATAVLTAPRAFHMDEPQFLAAARQILRDPFHPLSFVFNWYGCETPASLALSHSTLISYWLAAALKLGGGGEVATRLLCAPLDLAAAWALWRLASRWLERPTAAVLATLASPAWFLGVPLVLADKWLLASALWGLALAAEGSLALGALLLGLAVALKHTAVFALAPFFFLAEPRVGRKRALLYSLSALAPALVDVMLEPGRLAVTWTWNVAASAAEAGWLERAHRARSLLAFTGGACAFGAALALPLLRRRAAWLLLAAVPFLPLFDRGPVLAGDRVLGVALAVAGAAAAWAAVSAPRPLAAWAGAGAALSWLNYAVSGRSILLFAPALILSAARGLERRFGPAKAERLAYGAAAGSLVLSLSLSLVDARFADGQRSVVRALSMAGFLDGRNAWFAGHWGLQDYLERAGAKALDACRGGWEAARPGDVVVMPTVNADLVRPASPVIASTSTITIDSAIPLRLMRFEASQAGYYSDRWGFLPFAVSREPLDRIAVAIVLPAQSAAAPVVQKPAKSQRHGTRRP